jgi:hypothetical protein
MNDKEKKNGQERMARGEKEVHYGDRRSGDLRDFAIQKAL